MALGHRIPKTEMNKFREMIKTKGKEATVKAMQGYVAKKHGVKTATKALAAKRGGQRQGATAKKK
jgi:hypothetical protein